MDKRFDIPLVAEGLTAYAIERQNGVERHLPPDGPSWADRRRFWTDAILQGMARLEGELPDPSLMERYDRELRDAGSCSFSVPATQDMQQDTILYLRAYLSALEEAGGDRRPQAGVVQELLEDMASHLHWSSENNDLDLAREDAEQALRTMTARLPIRFTRVLLGGDDSPCWECGFVSGRLDDVEAVKATAVYERACRLHPEVKEWPVLCCTYIGGTPLFTSGAADASEYDLRIINHAGDDFLKVHGISPAGGPRQMTVSACEYIQVLKVEPGNAPESVSMPNTLKAFQAAVGGYIEAVGLDCGAVLICNEEGKLMGLPANRRLGDDVIAGTFLIVGEADGEFCSLTDTDAARCAEQFAQPMPALGSPDQPTQWEFHVF